MSAAHPQLPLPVTLDAAATFDNFHTGANAAVLDALQCPASAWSLWLHGARGTGKSHLLQAACAAVDSSAYATASVLKSWSSMGALSGFERFRLVCLDDVHQLLGDRACEEALFHLYNRLMDAGGQLIFAAEQSPQHLTFSLADLASRCRAARVLRVAPLDDEGVIAALRKRARRRDLDLPVETALYLIRHCRRDMHTLCDVLDTLDLASLAARRRLTVPFVKSLI
ncbi:MAG: DnaA regulatory inactivator Hda [Pseudomonadota bacterium]